MNRQRLWLVSLWLVMALSPLHVLAQANSPAPIRVTGAWARPATEQSAAYLHIINDGDVDDTLLAVTTLGAMAELHETQMENDIMRMQAVDELVIPADETVVLEPGSYHVMLMGLDAPLTEGASLPLTLTFASGLEVTVSARVTHTPIPFTLPPDTLTGRALAAQQAGTYVGQVVHPPVQVQDFVAPGSEPGLERLSDTNGTWRMVFFGYLHCPDFCPLTLVDYKRTKAELGAEADKVTFTYISVDPARDTPAVVREYLTRFDPDFIGFSPDDATLSRIQPDYGFYYSRRMDTGSLAVYTVDHSTRSYLIDPDGVLRASFAYHTDPAQLADALRWYMEHDT